MREQLKRERRRTEEPKPLDPASLREIDQMIQQDQDEVIFQYLLYRMAKESGL